MVASEDECGAAAAELGGPVALKLASARAAPQERGGRAARSICDGRRGAGRLSRALRLCRRPTAARVLVERMAPPGVELLVAARADAVVPALVVGLGGIWTEALDDVAIVPLPADADAVEAAIRSLRGAAALGGGRGQEPADLGAAAALAADAGRVALEARLELLELNPVVVRPRRLRGAGRDRPQGFGQRCSPLTL